MEYDFREILDIGLEIEFSNIKRETPNFVNTLHKELSNFKHVHDASTETPELTLGNIPVQFDIDGKTNKILSIMRGKGFEIFGGELNSPIMGSNDFRSHIYKLMNFLIDMGESFSTTEQDERGSIHVHVNVSKDIKHKHLIRLLELGLATEAIFYRLGGMGRVNRGVKNSFVYQRPLTMPPCIATNGRAYPIFDYKDLLETKTKSDFYHKYGDSVSQIQHGNHYVTQRYMGLNFYSIPYRGSIEFRYANKVLIPEWIIAWIVLCQSFVNFALTMPKDESFENEYRKLEDNRDIPADEMLFILGKIGVPPDSQITLLDIWHNSTVPEFNGKHILTHLPNPTFYNREGYLPNPIETSALRITVDDVRTVNQEKNIKLQNSCKDDNTKLDYVIDITGVKSKLKDIGNKPTERLLMNEIIIRNWQASGLDITTNFSTDDVINFVQSRIHRWKVIPFEYLTTNHNYEFNTPYDSLNLIFCLKDNKNVVEFWFYNENDGIESRIIECHTSNSDTFNCKAYNFTEYIRDCHENPDNYFGENEDDNELIFDDENNVVQEANDNLWHVEEVNNDVNILAQQQRRQEAMQELINRMNELGNVAQNAANNIGHINIPENGGQ